MGVFPFSLINSSSLLPLLSRAASSKLLFFAARLRRRRLFHNHFAQNHIPEKHTLPDKSLRAMSRTEHPENTFDCATTTLCPVLQSSRSSSNEKKCTKILLLCAPMMEKRKLKGENFSSFALLEFPCAARLSRVLLLLRPPPFCYSHREIQK